MRLIFIYILFIVYAGMLSAQESISGSKPIIGISCTYSESEYSSVRTTYTGAVFQAGGLPLLIPVTTDTTTLDEILSHIHALVLVGGEDVHPRYYGEEPIEELGDVNDTRDLYDIALITLAAERGIPILGICRGEQLINVVFGGTLFQDIRAQHADTTVNHQQEVPSYIPTHYVTLQPGSLITAITGQTELVTNTHHHQAVRHVAPGFQITAWACDSIPEAIEATDGRPILGVQFHPEGQAVRGDTIMSRFFDYITDQAIQYRTRNENPVQN